MKTSAKTTGKPQAPEPTPPPCSKWKVWVGKEIEGTKDIGVQTVFIREIPGMTVEKDYKFMTMGGKVARVWFCKEFLHACAAGKSWDIMRKIMSLFPICAAEVEAQCVSMIPKDIYAKLTVYVKLDIKLKDGDFVCVGPAFSDESFEIGKGAKVTPEAYANDTKVL